MPHRLLRKRKAQTVCARTLDLSSVGAPYGLRKIANAPPSVHSLSVFNTAMPENDPAATAKWFDELAAFIAGQGRPILTETDGSLPLSSRMSLSGQPSSLASSATVVPSLAGGRSSVPSLVLRRKASTESIDSFVSCISTPSASDDGDDLVAIADGVSTALSAAWAK